MRLTRLVLTLALPVALLSAPTQADAATTSPAVKHGLASVKYLKPATAKIRATAAAWSYNWTSYVPYSTPDLESVPMIRDARGTADSVLSRIRAGKDAGGYHYLLGFNEPDHSTQANLTPTQAANLWPKLQSTGLVLGSPSPALVTNGWLKQFMSLASSRHLRVDFIALHFYANITDANALNRIREQLALVRAHYGKPIWVTEVGLIDTRSNPGSASTNWAKAQRFLRATSALLDSLPYVQRWAWMADNVSSQPHLRWSSLYDAQGRLTPLGVTYRNLIVNLR